jgi:proteic killer suppression protein
MIRNFRHKGLMRFFTASEKKGINPRHAERIERLLDRLDAASRLEDMNLPGFGYHGLTGFNPKRYAVSVSGNWRITFAFQGEDAIDIDLEDYH